MVENIETKAKIQEIEVENKELKTKVDKLLQLQQRIEDLEKFSSHPD